MRKLLAMSAGALLCVAGSAYAAPYIPPADTPLVIKFSNVEQINVGVAGAIDVPDSLGADGVVGGTGANADTVYGPADNWGVFIVQTVSLGIALSPDGGTAISDSGNPPLFTNGQGGQIYGIFYDIQLKDGSNASGGILDLYWSDGVTKSLIGAAPNSTTVTNFTSGTFLARIDFASGATADPTTTIKSNLDVSTVQDNGHSAAFGNIDSAALGVWSALLDRNWFITPFGRRDISFENDFKRTTVNNYGTTWDVCPAGSTTTTCVGFTSSDPVSAYTTAVPEPATLTLLGLGLAGVAARRRKKAQQTV